MATGMFYLYIFSFSLLLLVGKKVIKGVEMSFNNSGAH